MSRPNSRRPRAKSTGRRRLTEGEFAALQANIARTQGRTDADAAPGKAAPESKFGNKRVTIGAREFASMREANRFVALSAMQDAGDIRDLHCQVRFELAPAADLGGKRKKPALRYFADFAYVIVATGERVVEDAKGAQTKEYRIKKHLMKTVHGIDIREV